MQTITINQARHEANIAAKAATLAEKGYTFRPGSITGLFWVKKPNGREYMVDATDQTPYCSCEGFQSYGECSHRVWMKEEMAWEASVEAREAEYLPLDRVAA